MSEERGSLLRIARRMGVSRGVFYSLLVRAWQFLAGPVTVIVIARFYSPDEQGFYYAFASILAMHNFFELGLFNVIINITAHEWAHMEWTPSGEAAGDQRSHSRLRSFAQFVLRWYSGVALLFGVVVATAGTVFLSQSQTAGIDWFGPWIAAVSITAAHFVFLPFNSILEGCSQVASVNKFLLLQAALGAFALWIVIPAGGGLWAPAASAGMRLVSNVAFLAIAHGRFLRDLLTVRPDRERMHWRTEVWPLQWRIGIQGAVSWFHMSLFVPVLFYYHGPGEAGRFGMTWHIVTLLQVAAYAWVRARTPEFGIHIARGDYGKLDGLWRRAVVFSLAALLLGAFAFELTLIVIREFIPQIGERFLDPTTTAILLAGRFAFLILLTLATYVRAHRIEPFAPMMVTFSLTQGVGAWLAGMKYGATGQAWVYLTICTLVGLPWSTYVYFRTRRQGQLPATAS